MRIACSLFLIAIALAPADLSAQLVPDSVSGCYDVEIGAWVPDLNLGADSLYLAPPSRVVLDTTLVRGLGGPAQRSLTVPDGALPSIHQYAGWILRPDTLLVHWSNGFSGFFATLEPTSLGFEGLARSFWDFGREVQTAAFQINRVACDSPPRLTSADQKQLPISITISGGIVLTLGADLAGYPGWEEVRAGRHYRRRDVVVDGLGPARSVEARLGDEGKVQAIHLTFPSEFDFDSFVANMTEGLGQPTGGSDRPLRDGIPMTSVSWSNRTAMLRIDRIRVPGGEWEVTFSLRGWGTS